MELITVLVLVAASFQMVSACRNCITLTKAEMEMFRLHSGSCAVPLSAPQAGALQSGRIPPESALQDLVLCVLQRCKVVGKDGNLLKSVHIKNPKVLELCSSEAQAQAPAQRSWRLLECARLQKTSLLHEPSLMAPQHNLSQL